MNLEIWKLEPIKKASLSNVHMIGNIHDPLAPTEIFGTHDKRHHSDKESAISEQDNQEQGGLFPSSSW